MKKLLAIDDQKDNLISIRSLLDYFLPDIVLFTAESGEEGIEIAKRELPDTILLDIIMPIVDGFEVCRILKQDETTKQIPIIMLSALGQDPNNRAKGLELGADAFLAKPFSPLELKAQIKAMLRIKEAEDKLIEEKRTLDMKVIERTEKLAKSEEKFRKAFITNPDSITISRLVDGVFLEVNKGFVKSIGYTEEEAVGKSSEDLDIWSTKHGRDEFIKILKRDGFLESLQTKLKTKDGAIKDVLLSARVIEIEGVTCIISIAKDITKWRETLDEITKLSTAVTQSPSIIVIADIEGKIEYVNPKFSEVTGYLENESVGQPTAILRSGEHPIKFYDKLWDTIKSGNKWQGEFHNRRKNGELFWEAASISPIINNNGEIINFLKVSEDINRRKQWEDKLKQSEEKFTKAFHSNPAIISLSNIETGKFVEVNQTFYDKLGYTPEEVIGKRAADVVKLDNVFREKALAKLNKDKFIKNEEAVIYTKRGSPIDVLICTEIMELQGEKYNYTTALDVSERKRSELIQKIIYDISKAVATTDSLEDLISQIQIELSAVIDTTNFFIALYDEEKDLLTLPFVADIEEGTTSMPAGKTLTKYVIRTQKPLLADSAKIKELMASGEIESVGPSAIKWLGVPLKIDGEVTGVLVVQSYTDVNAYDVADLNMLEFVSSQISVSIHRKQTERDLVAALKKATESDRLKTAFLQNISHEIRTPMNGIMGFASLLKTPELTEEVQQSYINMIMKSGNRMLNTLEDIMDISMLETDQIKLNLQETDINEKLNELYNFFVPEVSKKGIQFLLSEQLPEPGIVITDPVKLQIILSNLIKNAIKYTKEGKIEFGCKQKEEFLEFFVVDTGIGIPEDRQEAVFERFVQADISDIKTYEGTGLGLSIAKSYVEMQGGKIWLKSTVGEGSCFRFTIPLTATDEKPNELPEKAEKTSIIKPHTNKKLVVLIADDDETAIEYLRIVMKDFCSKIFFAINGEQAIELSRANPDIDLILMDIKMPKKNGYMATKKIREFNKDVVIIAQTAYALSGDFEKALAAGCNDYISKPIEYEALMSKIEQFFWK